MLGALQLLDKRSAPFDETDLALATFVGTSLAELAITAGLLPWLAEGGRLVPRSTTGPVGGDASSRELILSRILTVALDILAADRGWIFLYDPTARELY